MRIMQSVIILVLSTCIMLGQGLINDPQQAMKEGNQAFGSKKYPQAIESYEKLIDDYESVELFHNLSLAYFYDGNLAKSILFMERAKRISPLNRTVRKNLKLLYENVDSDIQNLSPFFLKSWWNSISAVFSSLVWTLIHILFLFLALLLLYFYLIKGFDFNLHFYYVRGVIIGLFVLSLLSALLAYNAGKMKMSKAYAIVLENDTPLRAGAESNALEISTLNAGLKVKIEDEINDLYKVKLGDLTEGWIAVSDLERI